MTRRKLFKYLFVLIIFWGIVIGLLAWPFWVIIGTIFITWLLYKKKYFLTRLSTDNRYQKTIAWLFESDLQNGFLLILSLIMALSMGELCLRAIGKNMTYMEKNAPFKRRFMTSSYTSTFSAEEAGWLHVYEPNSTRVDGNTEYSRTISANSIGCNDVEWPLIKKKYRIACIGDSFTEGLGASKDSTYEKIIEQKSDTIELLNCGVAGSDPLAGYMLLKQKIIRYKPDGVYFAINSSDIADVIARGGFERFKADGTTEFRKGPWWEWIYGKSFLVRLLVHQGFGLNWQFFTDKQLLEERKTAAVKIEACLDSVQQLCKQNNMRCTFIFHPGEAEVLSKTLDTENILAYAEDRHYKAVNLLDFFISKGVDSTNVSTYFWEKDLHYKNAGYRLFAEGVMLVDSVSSR